MSTTPRPPLLSDEDINDPKLVIPLGAKMIRDIYEAARAKDAELIQMLVDCIRHSYHLDPFDTIKSAKYYALGGKTQHDALNAAAAAGFTPTHP